VSQRTERVNFEGFRTTVRTRNMTLEQRKLFTLRGGGVPPRMTQGGWSTSVGASKGTHGEDGKDESLKGYSWAKCELWELCGHEVGFAGWIRKAILGLWGIHWHALPKGGLLADAADKQIVQWFQGDDALVSDKEYERIRRNGFLSRTWESYNEEWPTGTVNLPALQKAFRNEEPIPDSNDVAQVQSRLNHYTGSRLRLDGFPGPSTKSVYELYQCRLFGVSRDHEWADKIPGESSLPKLRFKITGL
jgi:hypothetical protein